MTCVCRERLATAVNAIRLLAVAGTGSVWLTTANAAQLIWEGDLEGGAADISGSGDADFKEKTAGDGQHSVVTASDRGQCPVREGRYMARFEIPSGATGTPQRAELKSIPGVDFEWDGTEYWVGYSFCAETWSGSVNTLFQVHSPNEDPSLDQCAMDGNLVSNHASGRLEIIDSPSGISSNGGANSEHVTVYNLDLGQAANQGVWHDFVFSVKVNTDRTGVRANCNGEFTAWHQGKQVYSGTGLCNVNYKDECGQIIEPPKTNSSGLHVGLYQGNTEQRVLFYDAMRVAIGNNGYDLVAPGGEQKPRPKPPSALSAAP